MSESWVDVLESFKHSSRKFVDGEAKRIEGEGGRVKDAHLRFGEPDAEIVRLGEELEAALVVVGSRGLGAVGRALMGSISDSVVRHAHCPVLELHHTVYPRLTVGADHLVLAHRDPGVLVGVTAGLSTPGVLCWPHV